MPAPKGNQFWKMVDPNKWAKQKHFKSPQELWDKACEYFKWCDDNPLIIVDAAKGGDRFGEHVTIPTSRPYTIHKLCLYLGISMDTFSNYEKAEGYEAYFGVTHAIKDIIYSQKFEGAAVGLFNANIIARDLGLTDKQEITTTKIRVKRRDVDN